MPEKNQQNNIYLAPMQGFTDFVYRKNFAKVFGHIDKYFCPYLSYDKPGTIKKSQLKDILHENNTGTTVIPQVLFASVEEFIGLMRETVNQGYTEINLNLGCPYPMVTNRGRGASLLQKPAVVEEVLKIATNEFSGLISIKLRSGLESEDEIFRIIEIINRHKVSEVIFHPRVARQLYKGRVNEPLFKQVAEICEHPLVYNGDIITVEDIKRLNDFVPNQLTWMIGRGVLQNPFLPQEIRGIEINRTEKTEKLVLFHELILADYSKNLSGSGHLLQKMEPFWSYYSASFTDPHKVYKLIKKANSIEKYQEAVQRIFANYLA